MTTVAPSASVRDDAWTIICQTLGRTPDADAPVQTVGGAIAVTNILIALEERFDIGIDVDEVRGPFTVTDLLDLVERRAAGRPLEGAEELSGNIVYWDDVRLGRGLPLYHPPRAPTALHPAPAPATPRVAAPAGGVSAAEVTPAAEAQLPPQMANAYPIPAEPEAWEPRRPIVHAIRLTRRTPWWARLLARTACAVAGASA
jgi:acyl carrier protein